MYVVITIILPLIYSAFEAGIILITFHLSLFLLGIIWYWVGGKSILRKNGILFLSNDDCRDLKNYISELIKKLRLKVKIEIGILDDALPNAFTLFLSPKK